MIRKCSFMFCWTDSKWKIFGKFKTTFIPIWVEPSWNNLFYLDFPNVKLKIWMKNFAEFWQTITASFSYHYVIVFVQSANFQHVFINTIFSIRSILFLLISLSGLILNIPLLDLFVYNKVSTCNLGQHFKVYIHWADWSAASLARWWHNSSVLLSLSYFLTKAPCSKTYEILHRIHWAFYLYSMLPFND